MPTYLARGVSARLAVMPLAAAVSPNIVLRKGEAAKQQSDAAETQLRTSKMLREVLVPFPGDEEQYRLNWLGNAPFMQVYACEHVLGDPDVPTTPEAKALVLHVNLSDRTYVSGLHRQKTSLKIDVFFNGQLSSCWFMSTHDVNSGVRGHHQVFAGTRVDFLAERPWILLPAGVAPDGSPRKDNVSVSVEQRWQDICNALQQEVRERGTNAEGEIPPTAQFLDALATMHMPHQVRDMQKPAGTAFGTIDLVITAGEGKKLTSGVGYLKAPKRMLDQDFSLVIGVDNATANPHPGRDDTECRHYEPSPDIIDVDAEGDSDPEYALPSKRQAIMSSDLPTQETGNTSDLQPRLISHPPFKSHSSSSSFMATPSHPTVSPLSMPTPRGTRMNMPSSGQGVGGTTSSDSNYQTPLPKVASHSSPVGRFPVSSLDQSRHPIFPFAERSSVDSAGFGSSPYPIPLSARSSCNTYFSSPGCHLFNLGTQFLGRPDYLSFVPSVLPDPLGHQSNGPPLFPFPHFNYQLGGPLPPAALYSVPTKPKSSISTQRNCVSTEAKRNASTTLVSRVVIFGQDEAILVDRKWHPPRTIAVEPKIPHKVDALSASPQGIKRPAGSAKHEALSGDFSKPEKIGTRTNVPSVMLPAGHANVVLSNGAEEQHTSEILSFHNHAQPKRYSMRATKQIPIRPASSWNSIRNMQCEDPEEMLHGAPAQPRRSRSSNKRYNTPDIAPSASTNGMPVQNSDLLTGFTSSPLSSLHSTPEPDVESIAGSRQLRSMYPSASNYIPQADGSDERRLFPSLDSRSRTRSSQKLPSTIVTPRIENYVKTIPQSSASKKRKALNRTVPKEARSPNRLKTCDNPVLNQNCVIAYAESKDSDAEQGILRQVRSERQGVFQEEYVVFAARFFIGEQ